MIKLIIYLVINVLAVLVLSRIVPNFEVNDISGAAFFVIILSILNSIVLPIVKIITLPITILTLGLFSLVLTLGAVAFAANVIPSVQITSTGLNYILTLVILSVALSICNSVVNQIT